MRDHGFHPVAWITWCAAAVLIVQQTSQPVLLIVALAAFALVAVRCSTEDGPFGLMIKVGLFALAMRVVLFGLAGHPGGTTLATVPQLHLPKLLGGVTFGGRVTGEVLITSGIEGLRLAAILVAFGVLLSAVEAVRLIRLVPRVLFEAGLVVAIGITFVPALARTARDVRDAQRMRGLRARGLRAMCALAIPIVTSALERAILVAESMDSRGWGTTRGEDPAREARARTGVLGSTVVIATGAFALLLRWGPALVAWLILAAGCAVMFVAMRILSRLVLRTRYARERIRRHDVFLIAGSVAAAVAAIAGGHLQPGAFSYSAYPAAHLPQTATWAVLVMTSLSLPVAIGTARAWRLRMVSA